VALCRAQHKATYVQLKIMLRSGGEELYPPGISDLYAT
jgi:hypothetical protein